MFKQNSIVLSVNYFILCTSPNIKQIYVLQFVGDCISIAEYIFVSQ